MRLVNKAELAEMLNISQTTLTEYQAQGLPIQHRGARGQEHRYDTVTVIHWLILHTLARAGAKGAQFGLEALECEAKKNLDGAAVRQEDLISAAAVYLMGRSASLVEELETLQGVEAKRASLERSDREFLNLLGVHGEALQNALKAFLATAAPEAVQALFSAMDSAPRAPERA
jgi:phage terminase Nu1 subunit (DNA packaging protein)